MWNRKLRGETDSPRKPRQSRLRNTGPARFTFLLLLFFPVKKKQKKLAETGTAGSGEMARRRIGLQRHLLTGLSAKKGRLALNCEKKKSIKLNVPTLGDEFSKAVLFAERTRKQVAKSTLFFFIFFISSVVQGFCTRLLVHFYRISVKVSTTGQNSELMLAPEQRVPLQLEAVYAPLAIYLAAEEPSAQNQSDRASKLGRDAVFYAHHLLTLLLSVPHWRANMHLA